MPNDLYKKTEVVLHNVADFVVHKVMLTDVKGIEFLRADGEKETH